MYYANYAIVHARGMRNLLVNFEISTETALGIGQTDGQTGGYPQCDFLYRRSHNNICFDSDIQGRPKNRTVLALCNSH